MAVQERARPLSHPDGETRLTAQQRDSFDTYHPLGIEHNQRIDDRLSVNFALGSELPATESTPLRVAGMKDAATLGLRYRLTARDRIAIAGSWDRYSAQDGVSLGSGQTWQVEAAHAIRSDPRDLEASVFWSNPRYSQRTDITDERLRPLMPASEPAANLLSAVSFAPDFFLPNGFRFYGIRLSTDTRFEREYTRAWRPYATLAKTWNTSLGPGYDMGVGIAGSVFGADHLSFGWKLGRGGATSGGQVREIGLTYRYNY